MTENLYYWLQLRRQPDALDYFIATLFLVILLVVSLVRRVQYGNPDR